MGWPRLNDAGCSVRGDAYSCLPSALLPRVNRFDPLDERRSLLRAGNRVAVIEGALFFFSVVGVLVLFSVGGPTSHSWSVFACNIAGRWLRRDCLLAYSALDE